MMATTAQEAKHEVAARQLAAERLLAFCAYVTPWFNPRLKHMKLIAEKVEAVERYIATNGREGCGRLIVMIQPQVGKTTLASNHAPAWIMGRNPDCRTILTSYNAGKATKSSREVRDIVTSEAFANVFGDKSLSAVEDTAVNVSDDTHAAADWKLQPPHRGSCIARGVGGGTTGEPGDLIICDDPHKDREEASSPTQLKRVTEWWDSQIIPRITNTTAVIIIQTRWDPGDLVGSRLKLMAGGDPNADWYDVVCIPALPYAPETYTKSKAEQLDKMKLGLWIDMADPLGRAPGSEMPVWPERHSLQRLNAARASSEFEWWSVFQQQPRPLSGGFFDRNDFEIVTRNDVPKGLEWVRYVDMAISDAVYADFNATVAEAHDPKTGDLYLRDMIRVRGWDKFRPILKTAMLDTNEKGVIWGLEKVAFQSLAFKELMRDKELVKVAITEVIPQGNKLTRALPLQYRAKSGHVKLVEGGWVNGFLDEAVLFTGQGRGHDDQIDTASGGMQMIGTAVHHESRIL